MENKQTMIEVQNLCKSFHKLEVLKDISSSAWETVEEYNINPYGNYLNWSIFWFNATIEDKEELVEYLIKGKDLIARHSDHLF